MGRYLGPKCRKSRRAGLSLHLKGIREDGAKCELEQPPGGGRKGRRIRLTEYGLHLREVQRMKWYYGILYRQFRRYYEEAAREPGNTGTYLLQSLERRLDNVVFRLRFAVTRAQARQMAVHGHIRVNGRKATMPSEKVEAGDIITPASREASRKAVQACYDLRQDRELPSWLKVDEEPLRGTVVQLPGPADLPSMFEPRLVVEYMGR